MKLKESSFMLGAILAILLAVGWRIEAARAGSPQGWDYKFIWVDIAEDGSSTWFEDADKALSGSVHMPRKSKELGAQGWELIAVSPMPGSVYYSGRQIGSDFRGYRTSTSAIQYVFRRPR